MTEQAENPPRKIPWLALALVLSLLLNLAAFAALGAFATRSGDAGVVLRAAVTALPREDRREMRREIRDVWRDARGRAGGQPMQRDMLAALRAEEFDEARFSQPLVEAQTRVLRVSAQMHERLLRQVREMTPEARLHYADALEEALRKQRRWREREGSRPRPD